MSFGKRIRLLVSAEATCLVNMIVRRGIRKESGGAWVAQSVGCPTSAQVVVSRFVSLSPASGSVLTARSLEPALDSVSSPLSAPPPLVLCLCLSKINKCKKIK